MKALYLVCREGLSAVFPSMVLAPVAALQRRDVEVELAVVSPVGQYMRRQGRKNWDQMASQARKQFGVEITRLPSPPTRIRWLWSDYRVVRRWVARHARATARPVVMHCRGPYSASLGLSLREQFPQLRVIFDMRGLTFAEDLLARGLPDAPDDPSGLDERARNMLRTECRVAAQADGLICVSRNALRWLERRSEIAEGTSRVVRNSVDLGQFERSGDRRDIVRSEIGSANRFVVCYCGSLREWQQHERGIALFSMLRQSMPETFFLGITPSPDKLRADLNDAGIQARDYAVVRASYNKVGDYLAAADLGLITRGLGRPARLEDKVSCPVKFAEYLAAGTPVLLGPDIGDCSRIATTGSVGLEMSPHERDPGRVLAAYARKVAKERKLLADRCRYAARRYHNLEEAVDQIVDLYKTVTNGPRLRRDPSC